MALIEEEPYLGVRGVWSRPRFCDGLVVKRKKVRRIIRNEGSTVCQRNAAKRPRAEGRRSVSENPDERRAIDFALVQCGIDGWCSFVPIVDCCARECVGCALERTARTKTAERALEGALLPRFEWIHGAPKAMKLRHGNGLGFGSRLYRRLFADYGLDQEPERRGDSLPKAARRASVAQQFTTPCTPEQNGLRERFIKTFKKPLCGIGSFSSLEEARRAVATWVHRYNTERPHRSLNFFTPHQPYQRKCKTLAA